MANEFSEFAIMAIPYSMCLVVSMTYNLLFMYVRALHNVDIVNSDPSSSGKDIDVFLRPLVDELKEL